MRPRVAGLYEGSCSARSAQSGSLWFVADPAAADVTVIVRSSGGKRRSWVRSAVSSLRVAGVGLVPCACVRASSLQVLWSAAGQGPGGLPTRRTRALQRALKISCTIAACAAQASVSVRMAGCSCPPSASARIWWIAKTGHRLGSVGVSAVGSGMASICCRPSR